MTIEKDDFGLFVNAGSWKARPLSPSRFKEGDEVRTYHFGGSTRAGVGKDASCKRGQYLETWCTVGQTFRDDHPSHLARMRISWYKADAILSGHKDFKDLKMTDKERSEAQLYMSTLAAWAERG